MKDSLSSFPPPGRELIIATTNTGKFGEICSELSFLNIQLRSLNDFPDLPEAPETGSTFEENARLKADFYYDKLHRPVLAEDSGLVIPSLGGFPGIHSARIANDDASRIRCVLEKLDELQTEVPITPITSWQLRAAYYVSSLVFEDGEKAFTVEGRCRGSIARSASGAQGFGYDPIFVPENSGKTFAEMDQKQKTEISHRGRALRAMIPHLISVFHLENNLTTKGTQ